MEKRHNYIRKVVETAVQLFISNDRPNIEGLILAGSADFKTELGQSDMFDPRLQTKVLKIVDVSYGGENGFNQAIELAAEVLSNVKFIQEKKLISRYFYDGQILLWCHRQTQGPRDGRRGNADCLGEPRHHAVHAAQPWQQRGGDPTPQPRAGEGPDAVC